MAIARIRQRPSPVDNKAKTSPHGCDYNQAGMQKSLRSLKPLYLWLFLGVLLTACGKDEVLPSVAATATRLPEPTVTLTPLPPTPTPEPLAARVNGEAITLVEFEAEVTRYISAQEAGESIDEDAARAIVLQDLVNQVLLSQGARELGFAADELLIQERLQRIIDNAGGERQFERWLEQNLYTVESFKEALARSIEAAWMRDRIIAETPVRAEQVHARQILLYTPEDAAQVLADLRTGTEFATLAAVYDPVTGGDLGWFPRGYLTDPELEEAAFSLQPGEYTKVIETAVGYHILQVIERDPARLLDPEALMIWQEQDLQNWIEQRRNQVLIEIFTS